ARPKFWDLYLWWAQPPKNEKPRKAVTFVSNLPYTTTLPPHCTKIHLISDRILQHSQIALQKSKSLVIARFNTNFKHVFTLMQLIMAVGRRDGRIAAEETLNLSKKQESPYRDAFIEDVSESFTKWDKTKELTRPLEFLQRLLEKAWDYDVNIDNSACSLIGLYLVVEGWQQVVRLHSQYRAMQLLFFFYSNETVYRGGTNGQNERGQISYYALN
ncbi:hypothetical protein IFM89_000796, partial [Coptis chinensis]